MKNIATLIVLILIGFTSFAQLQSDPKPFIEITGTSELEIDPDQIFIRISLQENTDRSKKTIGEQEQDLIKALKSVGISETKLVVLDANAYYGKTGVIGKEVISSKNLELEVKDATEGKKAFEQLDKLNIKNARISRVDHTEMDEYKREAKIMAIRAAKEKATYLLEAIDEKLGGAIVVRENAYSVYGNQMLQSRNMRMSYDNVAESSVPDVNLNFKKIKLTASVYVKWEIAR